MEKQATEIPKQNMLNGVNVDQLFGTVDAIKDKPGLAKFKFRARNKWVDGGHNRSTIKDFYGAGQEDASRTESFVLDADEPPVLLGKDKAAGAGEFVLHALAACLSTSLVYHAAARGIKIHEVESKLEGDVDLHGFLGLSDKIRNGYENVRVTMKVKGDASQEKLEELVQLAQDRSPILDTLKNPVPVSVSIEKG